MRENGRNMACFGEFLERSIKDRIKVVTNPLQFFFLLHDKRECVLQVLQLPSFLSYLALDIKNKEITSSIVPLNVQLIEKRVTEIQSDLSIWL